MFLLGLYQIVLEPFRHLSNGTESLAKTLGHNEDTEAELPVLEDIVALCRRWQVGMDFKSS